MRKIETLVEYMKEELEGANEYAMQYLEKKSENKPSDAAKYKEMAADELKHATHLHEMAVADIAEIQKVYTAPAAMVEKWELEHKRFIEKTANIRLLLNMKISLQIHCKKLCCKFATNILNLQQNRQNKTP